MRGFVKIGLVLILVVLLACQQGRDKQDAASAVVPDSTERVAVFAAGCFWSVQEGFKQLKGVRTATSGYAGGTVPNPSYRQVTSEKTGHAESVEVIYNPKEVSVADLMEAFMTIHDPTQLNRQGPDVGTSYRSIAFYQTEDEKKVIEEVIRKYSRARVFGGDIVTEVKKLEKFYPAESYHQDYYRKHPNDGYIQYVCGPKLEKLKQALPYLLKPEFQK